MKLQIISTNLNRGLLESFKDPNRHRFFSSSYRSEEEILKDGEQEKEVPYQSVATFGLQCEEKCDDDPFEDQSHRIFEYPQDDDNDDHVVQDDCDDSDPSVWSNASGGSEKCLSDSCQTILKNSFS